MSYSTTRYSALLIPDHRISESTRWAAHSTITQAGPLPGVPEPQQATAAVLKASGSQSSGATLDVIAVRGGFAGPDSARFAWKQTADSAYRGWDLPYIPHGWEAVAYTSAANSYLDPHALTLADGTILVAFGTISGSTVSISVGGRNATTGAAITPVVVYTGTHTATQVARGPCLVLLPSGRVLLYHWIAGATDYSFQVRMHYSDDDGATWTMGAARCLAASLDGASGDALPRLRAAYHEMLGQMLLVAHVVDVSTTYDDRVFQWASSDGGASFTLVASHTGNTANTNSGGYVECAYAAGGLVMFYALKSSDACACIQLGSAYTDFTTEPSVNPFTDDIAVQSGGIFTYGDLAVCVDDRGWLWALYNEPTTRHGRGSFSSDGGVTWTTLNSEADDHAWLHHHDAATYAANYSACWQRGRIVVMHNFAASPGTNDPSLCALYLGGYTTIPMPTQVNAAAVMRSQIGVALSWVPMDNPAATAWSATGTSSTEALTGGYLDLGTTANSKYYGNANLDYTTGTIVRASWSHTSGTISQVRILSDDGATASYALEVSLSTTAITMTDVVGAATVATAASTTGVRYDVLIALLGSHATVWWRTFSTMEDVEWTLLGTTTTLTSGGGGSTNAVRFGIITSSTSRSRWYEVHATAYASATAGIHLADVPSSPTFLHGFPMSADRYAYVDDGVTLAMQDGPAAAGDEWDVATRYQYPIRNLLLTESGARRQWRSTSLTEVIAAYQVDTLADADGLGDMYGVFLLGANVQRIKVEARIATVWTTLGGGGYQSMTWQSLTYTRAGNSVELTAYPSGPVWIEEDELVGQVFGFDATDAAIITRNTAGLISTTASTVKRPRLFFSTLDGTEPSSGSDGRIHLASSLAYYSLAGVQFDGLRVSLSKGTGSHPDMPEGYFRGKILIGHMVPLGWRYDNGRQITHGPNVEVFEAPDRSIRTRSRGPHQREWALSWDSTDTLPLEAGTDDYVVASAASNAEPVSMRHDTPLWLPSLLRHLDGPSTPLVYIPTLRAVSASGDSTVRLPRHLAPAVVRIVGNVRTTHVMGDEETGMVVRSSITLREDV